MKWNRERDVVGCMVFFLRDFSHWLAAVFGG